MSDLTLISYTKNWRSEWNPKAKCFGTLWFFKQNICIHLGFESKVYKVCRLN